MAERLTATACGLIAAFILTYCVKYEELCSDYAESRSERQLMSNINHLFWYLSGEGNKLKVTL